METQMGAFGASFLCYLFLDQGAGRKYPKEHDALLNAMHASGQRYLTLSDSKSDLNRLYLVDRENPVRQARILRFRAEVPRLVTR